MTVERRPTFPLEVPLDTLSNLLRAYIQRFEVVDRIERIKAWPVPLIEGGFPRKKRQADIRISQANSSGAYQLKRGGDDRSQAGEYLILFNLFKELYGEKKYEYNPREMVYLRVQKIRDATEWVKVVEMEREEALKKVETLLED